MNETRRISVFFIGLVLFLMVLAGCSTEKTGIANPASTNCIDKGGKLEIKDTDAGQVGYCKFPNGKECEEWAFYRGECTSEACGTCPMLSQPSPEFCKDGTIVPGETDSCGCVGAPKCEPSASKPSSGKLAAIQCTPEQKNAEICTMEYHAVCGWFNQSVKCLKYPCAINAGNPCQACATPNVEYYTEGECPTEYSDVKY